MILAVERVRAKIVLARGDGRLAEVTAPTSAGCTVMPAADIAAVARKILAAGRASRRTRPRSRSCATSSPAMTTWYRRCRRSSAAQRRAAAALIAGKGPAYVAELRAFMRDVEGGHAA